MTFIRNGFMRLLLVAVVADETSAFPVFPLGNAGVPPAWTSITAYCSSVRSIVPSCCKDRYNATGTAL